MLIKVARNANRPRTPSDHGKQLEITVENKSLAKLPDGVKVLAILDEDWPYFLEEGRCEERENLKRWEVPLVPTQRREGGQSVSYTKISQVLCNMATRVESL